VLQGVYDGKGALGGEGEEQKEKEASAVVA
jgi:hypothetical protein